MKPYIYSLLSTYSRALKKTKCSLPSFFPALWTKASVATKLKRSPIKTKKKKKEAISKRREEEREKNEKWKHSIATRVLDIYPEKVTRRLSFKEGNTHSPTDVMHISAFLALLMSVKAHQFNRLLNTYHSYDADLYSVTLNKYLYCISVRNTS